MSKAKKPIPAAKKKAAAKTPTKKAPAKMVAKAAAKTAAKAPSKKAPVKTAVKAPAKKASAKTVAKAPAKKTPVKTAVKAPAKKMPVKTSAMAPAKAVKKIPLSSPKGKSTTVRIGKTPPGQVAAKTTPEAVPGFSHGGLGVKTSSNKPGLSIDPGVMILGRAATDKTEAPEKTNERRLSRKELAEIKAGLMEKRERLLAGMRRELAVQRERAESKAADEVDKATDAYDEDLSFEIAIANDQELGEIQVALEKIDKDTYGECEICGCMISPSRLKVLPSATTCVACRGQEEQARRRDDGNPLFNMMGGEESESESGEI